MVAECVSLPIKARFVHASVMKISVWEQILMAERGRVTHNETATYNVTAEMTRVISFLLILAISLCV